MTYALAARLERENTTTYRFVCCTTTFVLSYSLACSHWELPLSLLSYPPNSYANLLN